jgi:hypothetical protein
MKRLVFLVAAVMGVVSLAMSHTMAMGAANNVSVCHAARNFTRPNGIVFFSGRLLHIPPRAIPTHVNHGDLVLNSSNVSQFLPNGTCCAFSVLPNVRSSPDRLTEAQI